VIVLVLVVIDIKQDNCKIMVLFRGGAHLLFVKQLLTQVLNRIDYARADSTT